MYYLIFVMTSTSITPVDSRESIFMSMLSHGGQTYIGLIKLYTTRKHGSVQMNQYEQQRSSAYISHIHSSFHYFDNNKYVKVWYFSLKHQQQIFLIPSRESLVWGDP